MKKKTGRTINVFLMDGTPDGKINALLETGLAWSTRSQSKNLFLVEKEKN